MRKRVSRKWRNVSGRRKSKAKVFSSNVVQQKVIQFQLLPRNFCSFVSVSCQKRNWIPQPAPLFFSKKLLDNNRRTARSYWRFPNGGCLNRFVYRNRINLLLFIADDIDVVIRERRRRRDWHCRLNGLSSWDKRSGMNVGCFCCKAMNKQCSCRWCILCHCFNLER